MGDEMGEKYKLKLSQEGDQNQEAKIKKRDQNQEGDQNQ